MPLHPTDTLGRTVYAPGDTSLGGKGQTIDGIPCVAAPAAVNGHAELTLFVDGQEVALPPDVGVVKSAKTPKPRCRYWVYTVGRAGLITLAMPRHRYVTLGQFFDIWGEPLSSERFARAQGPVVAYVNGLAYPGDPRGILLVPHTLITLEEGRPRVPPPSYRFPPGY